LDVYVKPTKKTVIPSPGAVKLGEIAEIYAPEGKVNTLKSITVANLTENTSRALVSSIDIIAKALKAVPGASVKIVGETETLVCLAPKRDGVFMKALKMLGVMLILFAGSSTAIMSFHSDAQMASIFERYYRMFFNQTVPNPAIINIPYSIGIAVGIILFFNHFFKKSITNDPTPIEVEMNAYDEDVTDSVAATLKESENEPS
jgi:stage V sporulation protein AA